MIHWLIFRIAQAVEGLIHWFCQMKAERDGEMVLVVGILPAVMGLMVWIAVLVMLLGPLWGWLFALPSYLWGVLYCIYRWDTWKPKREES